MEMAISNKITIHLPFPKDIIIYVFTFIYNLLWAGNKYLIIIISSPFNRNYID